MLPERSGCRHSAEPPPRYIVSPSFPVCVCVCVFVHARRRARLRHKRYITCIYDMMHAYMHIVGERFPQYSCEVHRHFRVQHPTHPPHTPPQTHHASRKTPLLHAPVKLIDDCPRNGPIGSTAGWSLERRSQFRSHARSQRTYFFVFERK